MKAQARSARALLIALAALGLILTITGCAATSASSARQFQHYFVPPVVAAAPATLVEIEPPPSVPVLALYAAEAPKVTGAFPSYPRPSDADFLLRAADEHFAAGKRAIQQGEPQLARQEFDHAIEGLMTAPESVAGQPRVQRRLEELVDAIYRYDVDELGAGQQSDEVNYEKSPLDQIGDMTFPIDPSLRSRVTDQIRVTTSQLPLEVQDPVVSFINYFSSPQGRKILSAGLRYAGRYRPLIEKILHEEGVPQELIFLAQAESGFQPRARSNKECVGLWQFATFTGRMYGLNQTVATDDRMDPEKATRAAARHLRDLYNHFGDWYLAMAAYNCGSACVDSAVFRTGYADFWSLRRLGVIPQETSNYVPIILAMTLMAKNPADYNLDLTESEAAIDYDSIELESATNLSLVAAALDRPLSEIKELNPSLLRVVAPTGSMLHVPKGTLEQLAAAFRVIPASRRDAWRVHRVESGDSLATIEKHYGLAPGALLSANSTQSNLGDTLEAGALLAVPVAYPGDPVPVYARARYAKAAAHAVARPTHAAAIHTAPIHPVSSVHSTAAVTAHATPLRSTIAHPATAAPRAPVRAMVPRPSAATPPVKPSATGTRSTMKTAPVRVAGRIG